MQGPSALSPALAISPDGTWLARLDAGRLVLYRLADSPVGDPLPAPTAELPRPAAPGQICFLSSDFLLHVFFYRSDRAGQEAGKDAGQGAAPEAGKDVAPEAGQDAGQDESFTGLGGTVYSIPTLSEVGGSVLVPGAQRILALGPSGAVVAPRAAGAEVIGWRRSQLTVDWAFLRGDVLSAVPAPEGRWLIEQRAGHELWDTTSRRSLAKLSLATRQAPAQLGFAGAGKLVWALLPGAPMRVQFFRASDGRQVIELEQPGRGLRGEAAPGRLIVAVDQAVDGFAFVDLDLSSQELRRVALPQKAPLLTFAVRPSVTVPEIIALVLGEAGPQVLRLPLARLAGLREIEPPVEALPSRGTRREATRTTPERSSVGRMRERLLPPTAGRGDPAAPVSPEGDAPPEAPDETEAAAEVESGAEVVADETPVPAPPSRPGAGGPPGLRSRPTWAPPNRGFGAPRPTSPGRPEPARPAVETPGDSPLARPLAPAGPARPASPPRSGFRPEPRADAPARPTGEPRRIEAPAKVLAEPRRSLRPLSPRPAGAPRTPAEWACEVIRWSEALMDERRTASLGAIDGGSATLAGGEALVGLRSRLSLPGSVEPVLAMLLAVQHLSGSHPGGLSVGELAGLLDPQIEPAATLAQLLPTAPLRQAGLLLQGPGGRLRLCRELIEVLLSVPCPDLHPAGGARRLEPGLCLLPVDRAPWPRAADLAKELAQPVLGVDLLQGPPPMQALRRGMRRALLHGAALLLEGVPGAAFPLVDPAPTPGDVRKWLVGPGVPVVLSGSQDFLSSLGLLAPVLSIEPLAPGPAARIPGAPLPPGARWRPALPSAPAVVATAPGQIEPFSPDDGRAAIVLGSSVTPGDLARVGHLAARDGAVLVVGFRPSDEYIAVMKALLKGLPLIVVTGDPGDWLAALACPER